MNLTLDKHIGTLPKRPAVAQKVALDALNRWEESGAAMRSRRPASFFLVAGSTRCVCTFARTSTPRKYRASRSPLRRRESPVLLREGELAYKDGPSRAHHKCPPPGDFSSS